jgi:regulator of replication initiation timing
MAEEKTPISPELSPAMQQIGMLNLRINDFMQQLNSTIKALLTENDALRKENAELKAKPRENQKTR